MKNNAYFPKLTLKQSCYFDLIRFIAAQLVVLGHLFGFMNFIIFPNYALGIKVPIQNLGVVLFFILSGYLISYSVYNHLVHDKYTFSRFFKDRFFRIYVTFIPCLILIALIDYCMPHYHYAGAYDVRTFIGNLFMLQDISYSLAYFSTWDSVKQLLLHLQITSFGSARPLWTLGIEWWLYMAFGWYVLKIMPLRNVFQVSHGARIILFLILFIVPLYNLIGRGNGLTLTWLFGSALFFAVYQRKITLQLSKFWFGPGNVICLYLLYYLYFNLSTFYDLRISLLMTIWFSLNLAFCNEIKLGLSPQCKKRLIQGIRIGGGYSYALYLVHYSIIQYFVNVYGIIENKLQITLLAYLTANVVAYLIYQLFDKNYKKIRDKFARPSKQREESLHLSTEGFPGDPARYPAKRSMPFSLPKQEQAPIVK